MESFSKPQHTLRANKYRMLLEKQNKKALNPNDTEIKVLRNKVNRKIKINRLTKNY